MSSGTPPCFEMRVDWSSLWTSALSTSLGCCCDLAAIVSKSWVRSCQPNLQSLTDSIPYKERERKINTRLDISTSQSSSDIIYVWAVVTFDWEENLFKFENFNFLNLILKLKKHITWQKNKLQRIEYLVITNTCQNNWHSSIIFKTTAIEKNIWLDIIFSTCAKINSIYVGWRASKIR